MICRSVFCKNRVGFTLKTQSGKLCQRNMFDMWNGIEKNYRALCNQIQSMFSRLYGTSRKEFTVAIEGNIGSGKTSLLEYFKQCSTSEVFMEPVKKWRNIQGQNALAKMYEDPSRWALTFQTYVQLTMLETHIKKQSKPVKMIERSIFSAKYCFVENLFHSGKMPELEYIILGKWFDFIIQNEDCHVDLIVYLQTKPEMLHERIKKRGRKEEKPIPLEYVRDLHDLHEDWLIHQKHFPLPLTQDKKPTPVLVLDANQDLQGMQEQYEQQRDVILCGYNDLDHELQCSGSFTG